MELTQRILDYYDKYLSEGSYLDELADSVAVDDLFAATVELLQSSDCKILPATLLFVQDLISYYPSEERQAVRVVISLLPKSLAPWAYRVHTSH